MSNKEGIIGEIILKTMEKAKNAKKPSRLKHYLDKSTLKQIFKDIIFLSAVIYFFIFTNWMQALTTPQYTITTDGKTETFTGNCTWMKEIYDRQNKYIHNVNTWRMMKINPNESFKFDENYTPPPPKIKTDIQYIIINATTTTTTTQTTTTCPPPKTCPPCTCEICPRCPNPVEGLTDDQKRTLLNLMPGKNNAAAYSGGYHDCLQQTWEIVDIPVCNKDVKSSSYRDKLCRPRYDTKPSLVDYNIWAGIKKVDDDSLVCFRDTSPKKDKTEFNLNNSIWMISNKGSMKWIHKL
jgi:hypothetical protein